MVGARGFEPPTPDTPCQCATRLRYAPKKSDRVCINNILDFLSKVQLPFDNTGCLLGSLEGSFVTVREPLCLTPFHFLLKGSSSFAFSGKDHEGKG